MKQRLTITVDPGLVEAGNRAVAAGLAQSLSAWVSTALVGQANRDQKLLALAEAIANYEAEHGEIAPEEVTARERADRASAVIVRGTRQP